MRKKCFRVALILVFSLSLISLSFAQRQSGAIRGTVTDKEGSPLPGANVTASGPALLGPLSYLTSQTGAFRFPSLPPGRYRLVVQLPGFKTKTLEDIAVNVGKSTAADLSLETAEIREEVTVTAPTPVVDVSSSKISINFTKELFQNIPIGRNISAIVATAPAVISDGGRFAVTGSSVRGNSNAFDGFIVEDPLVTGLLVPVNFDTVEEVEVELSAHPAEVGQAHGAYINIITKSGGNRFSGLAQAYFTTKDMVSNNFTDNVIKTFATIAPKGPTGESLIKPGKTIRDLDASFVLGGPVIKDKLWFFTSYRYFDLSYNSTGFNDPATRNPIDIPVKSWNLQGKLTFQLNPNHRFAVNWFRSGQDSQYHGGYISPYTLSEAVPTVLGQGTSTIFGSWNGIIDQNTFFDLRGGYLNSWYPIRFPAKEKLGPQIPGMMFGVQHVDLLTGFTYGAPLLNQSYDRERSEFMGSLTRFIDSFLGGSHELKLGIEYERSKVGLTHWFDYEPGLFTVYTANYRYMMPEIFGSAMGYLFPMAVGYKDGASTEHDYINHWSAYFQDSYTIAQRLTFNVGVRWDLFRPTIPAQTNTGNPYWDNIFKNGTVVWYIPKQPLYYGPKKYEEMAGYVKWSTFSPRLGIAYDPFGDGKTSLRASYSKYYERFDGQISGLINPNYWHGLIMYWMDLNKNNYPDLPDIFIAAGQYGRVEDAVTGLPDMKNFYDKSIRPPYINEITVGVDRELSPHFSLGVNYIWKSSKDIIELYNRIPGTVYTQSSMTEPGPDNAFGTGDDLTFPVYLGSGNAPVGWLTNLDGTNGKPLAERRYQAVEFIFNKKMADRFQLFGSVVLSKTTGNIGLSYNASYFGTSVFMDPNTQVNNFGRLELDRPLVIKLAGTYQAPYGIFLSLNYLHSSGAPYSRTVRVNGLSAWSTVTTVRSNVPESNRSRDYDNLDFRVEKSFNLGPGILGFFVDVFNVFNSAYVYVNTGYSGTMTYGQPGVWTKSPQYLAQITGLSGPRVFKGSIRYTF